MTTYLQPSVKKCQEVGETLGGTKLLNLKGMTFVVPLHPEKVNAKYQKIKHDIASKISITEDSQHVREAKTWQNSSSTISDLIKDAESLKQFYSHFACH